ncbi:ATP-binding protein [Mycobacterium sp. NPDC051804]|uniref:ATP-binding protein n=1 Tax=Mycobacterium sp. NPDC051804 TaxID=3364295 RepID=UPI0037A2D761
MTACGVCATDVGENAKFCFECGAPVTAKAPAEYKQVTVLFADVVRSMDLAAAVGPERLREIMAELLDRSAAVVRRYGGTLDKFTGDGIMAVFGAPIALEDHALRACMAALEIQAQTDQPLRIGLNSGEVIAGEIGSSTASYTAIGEQVGLAQRMESVAPPGGVMLSVSTARLVEDAVALAEPDQVRIKGSDSPVSARLLLGIGDHGRRRRSEAPLVGRTWELNTATAILDEAISGAGCVITIVGSPGIGKSRLVRETADVAAARSVPVFTTHCESHATDVPFHVVAQMMGASTGIEGLDARKARARLRERLPLAEPEDLLLIDDLLGIGDPDVPVPEIGPDARRRRVTAVVKSAAVSGRQPAVYVIEDAHWIDTASEAMLADFMTIAPQTSTLMVITYRPEYRGLLSQMPGAQTIALRPLSDAQTTALTTELVGTDPSLTALVERVAARAAGNPLFAEEIVRDLAEREIVDGEPGSYVLRSERADVDVPANLQSTIGARIDRLPGAAKKTLNAAAVIGMRFEAALLAELLADADVGTLISAELVDQVSFTEPAEYAFRHPMTRAVAYESQLKSDRAALHRRLATLIEARGTADENAALIATHLESAGELHAAFDWHMRAAHWSTFRNFAAAQSSWQRARDVADRLPAEDEKRLPMRIAPRALLCAQEFRIRSGRRDLEFSELRELCVAAGDHRSLAIGLAGMTLATQLDRGPREAKGFARELVAVLESINDPSLTVALSVATLNVILATGDIAMALRLSQQVIDAAKGETAEGELISVSPLANALAIRGTARWCTGLPGWRDDFDRSFATIAAVPQEFRSGTFWIVYLMALPNGVLLPDAEAIRTANEIHAAAERFGEQVAIDLGRVASGTLLSYGDDSERELGFRRLQELSASVSQNGLTIPQNVPLFEIHLAREMGRRGDVDGAIPVARSALDGCLRAQERIWLGAISGQLVELLLRRGSDLDLREAQATIDRLATVPTEPGFVLYEIWLLRLRALLALADGDGATYRDQRDRYRKMATELGFDGHIAWAAEMA